MKRAFLASLLLALLMVCVCAAAQAGYLIPVDDGTSVPLIEVQAGGDTWGYYTYGGETVLYSYSGSTRNVTLPASLNGVQIDTVDLSIVNGDYSTGAVNCFESVTVPEGIRKIKEQAFWGSNLEIITFPSTLQVIEDCAFYQCTYLREVHFAEGLVSIGESAFYQCASLTELSLPEGLAGIGKWAFGCCPLLSSVSLPGTLTAIGSCAFYCNADENPQLKELDIPDSVAELSLPIVPGSTEMIVGSGSPALAAILSDSHSYLYRIRGAAHPDEVEEGSTAEERAQAIVARLITAGMSDYEKALTLHDYVIRHAQYDLPASQEDYEAHPRAYGPEGVLIDHQGVCQSYSEAYELLMAYAGIPCIVIHSDTHAWNQIMLDGQWTHVDLTWDDPVSSGNGGLEENTVSGRENHAFFGLTDVAVHDVLQHQWSADSEHMEATDYTLNYAYRNGGLDSRLNQLRAAVQERLAAGETAFTFQPASFGPNSNANNYGISERLCLQIAAGETFTAGEGAEAAAYTVSFTYDGSTGSVTAAASLIKPQRMFSFTASTADAFAFPFETVSVTADGVAQANADGTVSFIGIGSGTIRAETETEILVYQATVENMHSLRVNVPEIREEAFQGSGAVRIVLGPDVVHVGSGAFADMDSLLVVHAEGGSVFDGDAFQGCGQLLIIAPADSPLREYAESSGDLFMILPS